jgi:hypothetical protein
MAYNGAAGVGNLRQSLTPLVGRVSEVADVTRLLLEARVVTLTGPAGVGRSVPQQVTQAPASRQRGDRDRPKRTVHNLGDVQTAPRSGLHGGRRWRPKCSASP